MKIKVTRNQLKECFINIYNVSYCGIQYIESYLSQTMYTAGVYGWNSDVYDCMNGYAISTGYRPCGNKHIDYDITEKYNNRFNRLKHKTSIKAIQYLQSMIQEQKQRESEKAFNILCRKIEEKINKAYINQWSKDNLEFYHKTFFSSYDKSEYTTVFYGGCNIPLEIEKFIVEYIPNDDEIEVNLDNLSDDIYRCSAKQLEKLATEYNISLGNDGITSYRSFDGFYAIIRNKDFNANIFNCGVLPYDTETKEV